MRTLVLLIFLTATLRTQAQTGVYHPFPDSNAVWNFQDLIHCTYGSTEEYYSIVLSGDTLIKSKTYHKLEIPHVQSMVSGMCDSNIAGYRGSVRQDTANRKVFIVPPNDSIEQLLFDFTMQVGDTVKGYIESIFSPDIVKTIDSVLIGNVYRKRWKINDGYEVYFIEGIGSTYGLVVPSPSQIVDLPNYWLTCFKQNGQTLYPDIITSCNIITSTININERNIAITLSPNPFHITATLEIKNKEFSNAELKIYDRIGRLVRR